MFRSIVSSSINVIIKSRRISTLTVHAPAATAKRSLALPIVFLSVQHWDYALPPPAAAAISSEGKPVRQGDADGANKYAGWIESFNAKGYTCLNLLVDPSTCTATAPTAILSLLESELQSLLLTSSSPFPPLLIASSHSTLLAQTYVSSHPLTALLLIDPTHPPLTPSSIFVPLLLPPPEPTTATTTTTEMVGGDETTGLVEFNYEPRFPLAVLCAPTSSPSSSSSSSSTSSSSSIPLTTKTRTKTKEELLNGVGPERLLIDYDPEMDDDSLIKLMRGSVDHEGWEEVMEWMDENGI